MSPSRWRSPWMCTRRSHGSGSRARWRGWRRFSSGRGSPIGRGQTPILPLKVPRCWRDVGTRKSKTPRHRYRGAGLIRSPGLSRKPASADPWSRWLVQTEACAVVGESTPSPRARRSRTCRSREPRPDVSPHPTHDRSRGPGQRGRQCRLSGACTAPIRPGTHDGVGSACTSHSASSCPSLHPTHGATAPPSWPGR